MVSNQRISDKRGMSRQTLKKSEQMQQHSDREKSTATERRAQLQREEEMRDVMLGRDTQPERGARFDSTSFHD